MITYRPLSRMLILAVALLGLTPLAVHAQGTPPTASGLPAGVTVVATGLTNPRGMAWGADGTLYLGLAGDGGATVAAIQGTPTGFSGGPNASVVAIRNGCALPVVEGLPSTEMAAFGWIWGVMDVAFLNDQLYVLDGGGGAVHGNPDTPTGLYRVAPDGTATLVADLGAWVDSHPVTDLPPEGFPNGGSFFDLEAGPDALYISEAVNGQVLKVAPDGNVQRVADLSAGHLVPTGIALAPDGAIYVGHEETIPYPEGLSKVIRVTPDGTITDAWTGLTAGTDVELGPDGTLYAAEMASETIDKPPFLVSGTGRVVRQTGLDTLEAIVSDVQYPVMISFGRDGALYLTYPAFGPDAGRGQGAILRIDLAAAPISLAGLSDLKPTCQNGSSATPMANGG